jgi:hypothetical protein
MNSFRVLRLVCFAILLTFLSAAYAVDITILPDSIRQTIDGTGHCHEGDRMNGNNYIISTNIQQMIDNHMTIFRDMFPNRTWEPTNDNSDANAIDFNGFAGTKDARCTNCLQRLKKMQDLGIKTVLGIWDLPGWSKSGNTIGNMDEVVEMVCAFLLYGKQQYGLDVGHVDFNESGSGVNIKLTSAQYVDWIKRFAARCKTLGLSTKAQITSCLVYEQSYLQAIWNDTAARNAGGNPAFHSYQWPYSSGSFTAWGNFRKTINRNLWCMETDYDWAYYNNADRNTWVGAREQARNYWSCYYLARASTTAGWYWYPSIPSGKIVNSYMQSFDPNGAILECNQPNTNILTLAYKHAAKNNFVIIVLNTAPSAQDVTFIGVPSNAQFNLTRTANNGDRAKDAGSTTASGNRLTVQLIAESFNTFVFQGAVAVADRNALTKQNSPACKYEINMRDRIITIVAKTHTDATIILVSLNGRILTGGMLRGVSAQLSTASIPCGVYCLKIQDATGMMASRVLVR